MHIYDRWRPIFQAAQKLWEDPLRIEIPAKYIDEQRILVIANYNNRIWSAVITSRDDKIRIISVRKSRENQEKIKRKYITASEFDEKFDSGEDLSEYLDIDNARRPELEQKKVSVNLPSWMVARLDHEAKKMGITRQSVIKVWIAEKLKKAVL